jgi:6-phosphogluconolactonase (cycloisomerase 2 family)
MYSLTNGNFPYMIGIGTFTVDPSTGAIANAPNSSTSWQVPNSRAAIDPSGRFLYMSETAANAPLDQTLAGIAGLSVIQSDFNVMTLSKSPYTLPTSSGPKDIVIDPTGRFLYTDLTNVNGSNSVAGFLRDVNTGDLTAISGSPFASGTLSNPEVSALAMHPTGKFLFAMNYANGTIAAFTIDANSGVLSQVSGSPFAAQASKKTNGIAIRGSYMAIDPSGNYLYLSSDDGEFAIYGINQSTGVLSNISNSPMPPSIIPTKIVIVQVS